MSKLLEGKNAIIYGGGGGIGVGRTPDTLDAEAKEITASGGSAETAVLDALDEHAVDGHVRDVVAKAGGVDVSFNLISRGDIQGIPLSR